MSINAFVDYISFEKKFSKHTVRAYVDDVLSFCDFCKFKLKNKNIDQASYSAIRSWMVFLIEEGVSNATVNRKLSSLRAYYNFLLRSCVIEQTPFIKHRALKTSKKIQIPFSEKEMEDCFQKNVFPEDFEGYRDRLIVELLYASGIRRSELISLKCSDLHFGDKCVKVLGKRNKERLVPLTKNSIEIIKIYLPFREAYSKDTSEDFLFLTKKGQKINASLVYRRVNKIMRSVSSKLKTSPHILRHTMATHVLNNGANLNDVKEILGHTSLVATQVYTHNSIAEIKKQYQRAHPRGRAEVLRVK